MVDEVAAVVGEALRAETDRKFVGRPAEVADVELVRREPGVQQRLEVPEILHSLGKRIADDHDVVVRIEVEMGSGGGPDAGHQRGGEEEQECARTKCREGAGHGRAFEAEGNGRDLTDESRESRNL